LRLAEGGLKTDAEEFEDLSHGLGANVAFRTEWMVWGRKKRGIKIFLEKVKQAMQGGPGQP